MLILFSVGAGFAAFIAILALLPDIAWMLGVIAAIITIIFRFVKHELIQLYKSLLPLIKNIR